MQRYRDNINYFPYTVPLHTRYNDRPIRNATISRDCIVRTPELENSYSGGASRIRKPTNKVRLLEQGRGENSVELKTEELMVDSFYHFMPGFATNIVHRDGNMANNNINNLVPLFGIQEEQEYFVNKLEAELNCRVRPMISPPGHQPDANLSDFLVSDTGFVYNLKSKKWITAKLNRTRLQYVKLSAPSIMDPDNIRYEINYKIHLVVCRTFNGPPDNENMVVQHIDNNSLNNKSYNLRWFPLVLLRD